MELSNEVRHECAYHHLPKGRCLLGEGDKRITFKCQFLAELEFAATFIDVLSSVSDTVEAFGKATLSLKLAGEASNLSIQEIAGEV